MNNISIIFFASYRDLTGLRELEINLEEGSRVSDLRRTLAQQFPQLSGLIDNALVALNKEYALDEDRIPDGAELALFPPVSGGSDIGGPVIFEITEAELDIDRLLALITLESTGAACIFTGMVRGVTLRADPHETVYLEYEAYKPMAEQKMRQITDEIRQRWPDVQGIAIVQRIGRLYPRTPTVFIACTAAHRDTGVFEAARYGIDRLKEIVPVWKKEVGPHEEQWVEGDYLPGPDD